MKGKIYPKCKVGERVRVIFDKLHPDFVPLIGMYNRRALRVSKVVYNDFGFYLYHFAEFTDLLYPKDRITGKITIVMKDHNIEKIIEPVQLQMEF